MTQLLKYNEYFLKIKKKFYLKTDFDIMNTIKFFIGLICLICANKQLSAQSFLVCKIDTIRDTYVYSICTNDSLYCKFYSHKLPNRIIRKLTKNKIKSERIEVGKYYPFKLSLSTLHNHSLECDGLGLELAKNEYMIIWCPNDKFTIMECSNVKGGYFLPDDL